MTPPNMIPEIIEAIHLMYEDTPDVEIDCLLCLSGLRGNFDMASKIAEAAEMKLDDMDRCFICGSPLQAHHYFEPHPELDGCPSEQLVEMYCPNCDL